MFFKINGLVKNFNQIEVLNIPQFSVAEGAIVGLLGNNGAGKTTLFRLSLDLLGTDIGTISIENQDVSLSKLWKNFTSAFIDERFLIDFLTPKEYFHFIGELYGMSKNEVDTILVDFIPFMADEILNQKKVIEKFSKGNKQKIGIIGAMLTRPRLLILDEPFNFLDPSSQLMMKKLLLDYNRKYNTTVFLSSHNIQHVMDICTRIIVLESGYIVHDKVNLDNTNKLEIENYFKNGVVT
jgi:ABC-2 type transport system ATP-binding protein